MGYGYYVTGFDGYAYTGLGSNPVINRMYANLSAIGSLFQLFNRHRISNNDCGCGTIGQMLGRCCNPYQEKLIDGDYLPLPGSNIPTGSTPNLGTGINVPLPNIGEDRSDLNDLSGIGAFPPIDFSVDQSGLPELPNLDILNSGILTTDIMSAGAMPPMANPLLALLPGYGTMDPLLGMGMFPAMTTQSTSNTNTQHIQALQQQATQEAAQAAEQVTIDPNDSQTVTIDERTGKVTIGKAVYKRIQQIAQKINCDPKDLMGVIYKESAFRTVPKNWDGKHAVGLIQWTQIAIDDLNLNCGTSNLTKQKIAQMNVMQQLDLAEITLIREKEVAGFDKNHRLTAGELYAMNFLPGGARQNVVSRRGDGNYEGNSGLDINGDGDITQQELAQRVQAGSSFVYVA